jgi:hypothetical protein
VVESVFSMHKALRSIPHPSQNNTLQRFVKQLDRDVWGILKMAIFCDSVILPLGLQGVMTKIFTVVYDKYYEVSY